MKKEACNAVMERIYRILSYIAVGTGAMIVCGFLSVFLLLGLVLPMDYFGFPEWLKNTIVLLAGIVCYGGVFYLGARCFIRTDRESEHNEFSRMQSCGLWGMAAILAFSISLFASWYLMSDGLLLIGLSAVLLAAASGIIFPFKRHLNGGVFGCGGLIAAFLILMFSGMIMARTGRTLDYSGNDPQAISLLTEYQKKLYFPKGASQIKIEGTDMACTWSCLVSEADFLTYQKDCGLAFVLNRSDVNEDAKSDFHPIDQNWPRPYYFYNRRHRDGGGLTLHYSVPEQKLYGSYAHH